jgi:hypothetical protein
MTNLKSYDVMVQIKLSRVSGPGISTGAYPRRKKDDHLILHLLVIVSKSVSENPSRINKFLVVVVVRTFCGYENTACGPIVSRMYKVGIF